MTENYKIFRTSKLTRHAGSSDNKAYILAENGQNEFVKAVKKLLLLKKIQ